MLLAAEGFGALREEYPVRPMSRARRCTRCGEAFGRNYGLTQHHREVHGLTATLNVHGSQRAGWVVTPAGRELLAQLRGGSYQDLTRAWTRSYGAT